MLREAGLVLAATRAVDALYRLPSGCDCEHARGLGVGVADAEGDERSAADASRLRAI